MTGNERRTCSSCGWKTASGTVVEREDGTHVWRCAACTATEAFIARTTETSAVPDRLDVLRSLDR
jgi:transcription elongation factor Elf1